MQWKWPLTGCLFALSHLCFQGLDRKTVEIVMDMCGKGANPETVAEVIKYLRRERQRTQTEREEAGAHRSADEAT